MFDAIADSTPLFLAAMTILGLLIGSFLNVVILRLPARLEHDWTCQCRELLDVAAPAPDAPPPGILWDRSRCRSCGHTLSPLENIPLLSYLWLLGRCSSCGSRISLRYPLVEALTGAAFLVVAMHYGPGIEMLAALVLTSFLIALTGIDFDHQLLPDDLTLPLLWIGLSFSLRPVFVEPATAITGAAVGYLALWSVYHLFRLLTGREGMGHGDFKLLAALGAWLGWQVLPLIILLSSLSGALVGGTITLLRRDRRGQPIPFGPFIAVAGWIALLWGHEINHYYLRLSGLS